MKGCFYYSSKELIRIVSNSCEFRRFPKSAYLRGSLRLSSLDYPLIPHRKASFRDTHVRICAQNMAASFVHPLATE
jgi:hypothetical protein